MRGAWTADRVPPFVPSGWDGPSSTTDSLIAGTTSPFPCLEDRKGQHLEGFCPSAFVIILGNERRGFECPSNQRTSFLEVVHSQASCGRPPTVPRWIALTTSTPASPSLFASAARDPGWSSSRTTRTVRVEQAYPCFTNASRACMGWLAIRLT